MAGADLTDVYSALQQADAAGDTASAQQLADYIRGQTPATTTQTQAAPTQSPNALGPVASAAVRPIAKGLAAFPLMAMDAGVASRNLLGNAYNSVTGNAPTPNYELPSSIFSKALDYYTQPPQGAIGKIPEFVSSSLVGGALPGPTGPTSDFVPPQQTLANSALTSAQGKGYVVPPSANNPSFMNRLLEGIAGKAKTAQQAREMNEGVTQQLAARSLGQTSDAPITQDALEAIRSQAGQAGYDPLRQLGQIPTDSTYLNDIVNATKSAASANKSFGGLSPQNDLSDAADAMAQDSFDASHGLDAISVLRDKASDAFSSGNASLGKGYKQLSGAVENMIDRHLQSQGPDSADLLTAYRNARTLMAKTYTIGGALSDETGTVNAMKLGQDLAKGKPLTGDQLSIADFARNFRDFAGRPPGSTQLGSPIDLYGAIGAAGVSHNPLPLLIPFGRNAAKDYLLSPAGQARAFLPRGAPSTNVGLPGLLPQLNYLFNSNSSTTP